MFVRERLRSRIGRDPGLGFSKPARNIAASIGSTEKMGTAGRERGCASMVLPEPGRPDKTISVGDIFVISVMKALEKLEQMARMSTAICGEGSWLSSHIFHHGGGPRKRQATRSPQDDPIARAELSK